MLADHPAVLFVFCGNLSGRAQSQFNLFSSSFGFGHSSQLPLDRPCQIDRGWPGSFQSRRGTGQVLIKRIGFRRLDCRQVHPVAGARSDQARAAHMHLADGVCHLLDRAYFLDDEPVRQKPLIDQLHHPLVSRVQPDRPEMLFTNLHRLLFLILL